MLSLRNWLREGWENTVQRGWEMEEGMLGRAQGCWSSWGIPVPCVQSLLSLASLFLVSLSLVSPAFLPYMSPSLHPPSWCPHPMGLGVSRTHVGGRGVKAQGTEGACRTLQVVRRS